MAESKEQFHTYGIGELIEAASTGLLVFEKKEDENYQCVRANNLSAKLIGENSPIGKNWASIVGDERFGVSTTLADWGSEVYLPLSERWCRVENKPLDKKTFLCTLTDITAQKDTELENKQITEILSGAEGTIKFGSWMGHTQGNANSKDWWSVGLYELLGYSPEEAQSLVPSGDLFYGHVHPEDRPILKNAVAQSFREKAKFEAEYRIKTRTGEEKFVVSRGMYRDGDQSGPAVSYGNAFDMTPIRKIRTELERKVKELNRSNFDLEQFAYVASHDLQEPLRKIVSFGERLEAKSKGALNEESTLYLSLILSASRRMQDMIVNLLEFSRVARSREGFTNTDLDMVMAGVLSDLEITIQSKGAQIKIDALPQIEAIPTQMAQLFQNLLTNSLKFTREGVTPAITIDAEEIAPAEQLNYGLPVNRRYLRLLFSDNGIGFSNQDSSRIFTLFQRLRGRSEYEGAGIGLSVCKKVVENHCGVIMASARPDEGALFTSRSSFRKFITASPLTYLFTQVGKTVNHPDRRRRRRRFHTDQCLFW